MGEIRMIIIEVKYILINIKSKKISKLYMILFIWKDLNKTSSNMNKININIIGR